MHAHRLSVVFLLALVAACGGGGNDSSNNAPVGGIWTGTLGTGELVLGFVAENGEFHLLNADTGDQYFGNVSSSGNNLAGQFTGFAAAGSSFFDGSTRGTGSLTGTVTARLAINADTSFTTSGGMPDNMTITLAYQPDYDTDSSLAVLAGNFVDFATGAAANINANGDFFLQDPASGCVINGTVTIIDSQFNAYRVQYTWSNCTGVDAVLNGITFRGLAALDTTSAPQSLVVLSQGQSGSTGMAAVHILERN